MTTIDRRQFLERMLALGGAALTTAAFISLLSCSKDETPHLPGDNITPTPPPPAGAAYLAVARGENPTALVQRSVGALGGIERFVKPGNDVIIKPNICVPNRAPQYAATTNPEVVAALVALCLGAGAGRVRVMDNPFGGSAEESYADSGIAEAVKAAGGEMEVMATMRFQDTAIPEGQMITHWPIYQDVLDCDVLIDVPIAKHHGLTRASLGLKNLLGVVLKRGDLHTDMSQKLPDLATLIRPDLTLVDGVRTLMQNGPTGGKLEWVKQTNTIVASHDIVAADAYASTLLGLTGAEVSTIRASAQRGLGTMDLSSIKIEEIAA